MHPELMDQGREARLFGYPASANPFAVVDEYQHGSWLAGWAEVHADPNAPKRPLTA